MNVHISFVQLLASVASPDVLMVEFALLLDNAIKKDATNGQKGEKDRGSLHAAQTPPLV